MTEAAPDPPAMSPLTAALTYAGHGWSVFPCKRDKRPYTETGFKEATREARQIETWWGQWPDAAVGISCGASNLLVVDHDPKNDPDRDGLRQLGKLLAGANTRQARTGSGGTHYYFRMPAGAPIRNSAGLLGPGLDVRGEGGYVIAPPSQNTSGRYVWANKERVNPPPDSIVSALRSRPERKEQASGTTQGGIPEGRRNDTLQSMAGTLWRRGMSPLAIEQALLAENLEHCNPPLPNDEVLGIARRITLYPSSDPIAGLSTTPHSTKPEVELLASDALRVSVTLKDDARAAFLFTEMEKERRELNAHVAVAFFGGGEPYEQRINLESNGARTEMRRELDNLYGKDKGWSAAINSVWTLARRSFLNQDRGVSVTEIPALVGQRFLVDPLMPADGMTILFGDGSTSKSYIALSLAIASVAGVPQAGRYTAPQCNVLYIDFEDSDTNFRRRTHRIMQGLGSSVDSVPGLIYWGAHGIAIKDSWDSIKRTCDRNNIGWMILDSAAPACGGPPEESQSAVALFNAIKKIGRPCLTIAHINKSGNGESTHKPFGTAFWHNLARRTWFIDRAQDEESDVMDVALYCRKVNDGRKPRPIGFRVTFSEAESGPVTFETADPALNPVLAKHSTTVGQIWGALTAPLTLSEIAEQTGISYDTVRINISRHADQFQAFDQPDPDKPGKTRKVVSRIRKQDNEGDIPF